MSPTKSRIIQYVIIIAILTLVSGAGYAWYSTRAAINSKAATNNGLVGYWSFDEGSGTQAGDASGNGNTGTLTNGPTWVDGKLKKAISFDGADDYVSTADKDVFSPFVNDISISVWAKVPVGATATGGGTCGNLGANMIGKGSAGQWEYVIENDNNSLLCFNLYTSGGSGVGNVAISRTMNDGQWHQYSMTIDYGVLLTAYIDGVSMGTSTAISMANGTQPLEIGRRGDGGYFVGQLDEVRIYNRALTGAEITNLYNLGAAKVNATKNSDLTNGLVGLWSFDGKDISGTTAYDRSGQSNNGTLTNGPAPTLGKLGQALSFDGTNDYIDLGSSTTYFNTAVPFSVALWLNPNKFDGTNNMPFSFKSSANSGFITTLTSQGGYPDLTFAVDTASSKRIAFPGGVTLGQWRHVVITYNGAGVNTTSNYAAYVDGLAVTVSGSGMIGGNSNVSNLGGATNGTFVWDGKLDDVRVYNRALSENEVRDLYQLGASDKVNSADVQIDPLEKGLTSYWKLDENTGTTTADASGNGNTGTFINGPTWGTGRIGSGVTFDGTNDYLNTSALSLFTNTFTVSFWAKMSSSVGDDYIFDYRTGTSLVAFRSSAGANDIYLRDASGNTPSGGQVSPGFLYDGNWHMYSITADGSNARAFRDGVQQGVERAWTYSIATGSVLTVGSSFGGGYEYFNGSVDEVRTYNRALSSEEMARLYQTTTPDNPDTSLKGYWSFDGKDVSGTTAYDRSGNGKNGTLTNGPVPTIGKIGQALNFDGTNDCVASVANSPDLAALTQASVAFWIKPKIFLNRTIFTLLQTNNGGNGAFANGFEIGSNMWTSTEAIRLAVDGTSVDLQARSNSLLSLNVWTHVVVTWGGAINGTDTKFYFNGTDVGTTVMQAGSGSYVAGDGRYKIGSAPECAYGFLDGTLDDLRVYNRVLTATEITNLYNQGR